MHRICQYFSRKIFATGWCKHPPLQMPLTVNPYFPRGSDPPLKIYFPLLRFPPLDNFSTPLFCDILQTRCFATFCSRKGMFLSNIELAMFMHRHSLNSNEPKNSWIFLTSTYILRFDHYRCLEKRLLKLLGVRHPF